MAFKFNDGANWQDSAEDSPPDSWQAEEEDNRFWFTSAVGVSSKAVTTYIGTDAFPSSVTIKWEITVAPTGGQLQLGYNHKGVATTFEDLGSAVASGTFEITDITTDVANPFEFWIVGGGGAHDSMGSGTVAINSPEPSFNCTYEADPNARTLLSLRDEIIARLGFVKPSAAISGETLTNLRSYLMRRLGFSAQAASPPTGMNELLTEFLNEAQDTLWRIYAYDGGTAPTAMSAGSDTCDLDSMAVKLLALANAKSHYGQDSKPFYDQLERMMQLTPVNLVETINSFLRDAQAQLYRQYDALRTERFYFWTMEAGQRYYDVPDNEDADTTVRLDAHKVTGVWVQDLNGAWYELAEGIDPVLYTMVDQQGYPERYEIRACIEVFPAPADAYTLRIKGHFGLQAFTADADKTTINPDVVFEQALGLAKAHFRQADAEACFGRAQALVLQLVAGSHMSARYLPGTRRTRNAVRPTMDEFDA